MANASTNATPPPRLAQFLNEHSGRVVAGLLILFAAMAWSAVREKSTTFDETAHLTAGTAYWQLRDYRLHPENGILPQRLETLPLVLMGVQFPETDQAAWWKSDVWTVGDQFFHHVGNDLERMLWWARGTVVALGVVLGWVVYTWSRRLFGVVGGIVSLVAYVFCPNILAHSALATSDLAAALMFVASLGCLWLVYHRVSVGTVALSSVVMGLLFVSKMSAVLILPTGLVLLAIRLLRNSPLVVEWRGTKLVGDRWRQLAILTGVLAVHAVIVWATIWAFFGFRYATFTDFEPGRDKFYYDATIENLTDEGLLGPFVRFAYDQHLLPQSYLHGFAFALEFSQARMAFFNGERNMTGWRTFFPYAFLVKTPLPTFGLMLAAACAAVASWTAVRDTSGKLSAHIRRRVLRGLYRTAPLWVFFVIYWVVAIRANLNIGHRHILPTYPLVFILCGAAGYWLAGRAKWPRVAVEVLVILLAIESLTMYPHYLAYFNQLVGGPKYGYRHLVDSSLDWGQDLPGLKRWLDEEQDPAWQNLPVYLSYFGTGRPQQYNLNAHLLPGYAGRDRKEFFWLEPGTYAISATMLPCVYLQPWQPWNAEYEGLYQSDLQAVAAMAELQRRDPGLFAKMASDPAKAEELQRWSDTMHRFDELRFARLCNYLWQREPYDSVGHSILIYHLDANDLDAALNQPARTWD